MSTAEHIYRLEMGSMFMLAAILFVFIYTWLK